MTLALKESVSAGKSCSHCSLYRSVQYIKDSTLLQIRKKLDTHKVARDDVGEYNMYLMQRQQLINERLVAWGNIISGEKVLDACCGPEGSSIAVLKRGGVWSGNEISQHTYEHLIGLGLNVKNGTAEKLPFKRDGFQHIIYCYAVNNIQATPKTFQEAYRVLEKGGNMLIADPGLTRWLTDLLIFSVKDEIPDKEIQNMIYNSPGRFGEKIPKYFMEKQVSPEEYSDVILSGLLGINKSVLIQDFEKILNFIRSDKKGKMKLGRFIHYFHLLMNAYYWENLITSANMSGFLLKKSSFFSCYQNVHATDWDLSDIVNVDIDEQDIYSLRNIFTELQLPKSQYAEELRISKKGVQKFIPTLMLQLQKH